MLFELIIARFPLQLNPQRTNKGFTLVELLVVSIIIGILAVIAIPSLTRQVGKAREAEARGTLSTIGQAQQAHFAERRTFSDTVADLDVDIISGNYSFPNPDLLDSSTVKHQAISLDPDASVTRNYSLGVYHNANQFSVILCQSLDIGGTAEAPDTRINPCVSGTKVR